LQAVQGEKLQRLPIGDFFEFGAPPLDVSPKVQQLHSKAYFWPVRESLWAFVFQV